MKKVCTFLALTTLFATLSITGMSNLTHFSRQTVQRTFFSQNCHAIRTMATKRATGNSFTSWTQKHRAKLILGGCIAGVGAGTSYYLVNQPNLFNLKTSLDLPRAMEADRLERYIISLMWINRQLDPNQTDIINTQKSTNPLKEKYIPHTLEWAKCNPRSTVHFWYDSELTSAQAVINTKSVFTKHKKEYPEAAAIVLKDVRDLDHVKKHPEVFSDKIPVFFRTDLLRIIASVEELNRSKKDYLVYADLDVTPMSKNTLFDRDTQDKLDQYGIVVAGAKSDYGYENSFHILSKHSPALLETLLFTIVDLNTKRAYNALDGDLYDNTERRAMKILQQIVYESYPHLFMYYYHQKDLGSLKVDKAKEYTDRSGYQNRSQANKQ